MRDWIWLHLDHVLVGLLFLARLGDIGSTYLVTPKLVLEANPVVRRLRWRFAWLSTPIVLVPYWHTGVGVMMLIVFLMVVASNLRGVWFVRAIGEHEQLALLTRAAGNSSMAWALFSVWGSALWTALAGAVLFFFYPEADSWGHWCAWGILGYAVAIVVHQGLFMRRLFQRSANEIAASEAPEAA